MTLPSAMIGPRLRGAGVSRTISKEVASLTTAPTHERELAGV
jgi:hypothetical protein